MDIDFVVLWVDGNDPAWQAEKSRYEGKTDDNNGIHRYRDWGLMKYWFRSIEAYAPWVRKVHFVTWGHLPPFLDVNNPKLHIVRHEDYMPAEALPCFNSCALEMNLHRIDGLAEHFVYFNDDVFLTRPMTPGDFFSEKTGMPCAQFCEMPCCFEKEIKTWNVHLARGVGLINKWFPKRSVPWKRYFGLYLNRAYPMADNIRTLVLRLIYSGYFTGLRICHTYFSYRKSTFEELWEREPELLMKTTKTRFRSWEEINQYTAYMWQLASGQFAPARLNYLLSSIQESEIDAICRAIETKEYDSICLNDPSGDVDFENLASRLEASFEKVLPGKSSYEK